MKIVGLLIIFLAVCAGTSYALNDQLVSAMKNEIANLAATAPPNAGSLINNIKTDGDFHTSTFAAAQIDTVLSQQLKLAAPVIAKFKAITFSDSVAFQTFSMTIDSQTGSLQEFIGAARNVAGTIDLAFLQVQANGNLVPQTQDIATRHCHKRLLVITHCTTEHHSVNRGFTTAEISLIGTALRAAAYAHLQQKIANPPARLVELQMRLANDAIADLVAPQVLGGDNDQDGLLNSLIAKVLAEIPALKKAIDTPQSTEIVEKIIGGKGFTYFAQKADVQQVNGVKDEFISVFLSSLQEQIDLPQDHANSVSEAFQDILYEKTDTWVVYRVVFSADKGGDCKYVCVMGRHHTDTKKTDWLVADVQATFKLAPDVLVVKESKSYLGGLWSSSDEKLVFMPKSLNSVQLNTVFDFFEIVAFERFAEILHITSPPALGALTPNIIAMDSPVSKWGMLQSAVSNILDDWTKLVQGVKSSSSSTIMSRIVGQGFDRFEESAQMQQIDSMVDSHLPVFFAELKDRLSIPAANQKDFDYVLSDLPYEAGTVWTAFHIVFSSGSGGECKSVSFLAHHNQTDQTTDFLLANIQATFNLAPDVFIVRQSKSILGGIWSSTKDVMKKVPRGLNQTDLEAVFDFFEIVAWKKFADLMGIKVNNPSI